MGGDGGSIPGRQDLVRTKRKPEQAEKEFERVAKWKHCSITQEPLRQPIVACELGMLYNKESVLEYLIETDKSAYTKCQHIKSLKDIKDLHLTENPTYKNDAVKKGGGVYNDPHTAQYVCPVTGLEMNGRYKFCFLWKCGCVFAERALKEIKSDTCHSCDKPYDGDWIMLNGSSEDVELMRTKMEERKARIKAEKKAKKAQKRKLVESSQEPHMSTDTSGDQQTTHRNDKEVEEKDEGVFKVPGVVAASTKKTENNEKLTNKLGKEKKPKTQQESKDTGLDKKKAGYRPEQSQVYKSLFINKDEKREKNSHWVTYNPYYSM
ncbi:replication termination factor 2-like [Anneissia japonica]|uniref:replication termination factor 2-like n=1 Tax=Anneissia japonica TaxID=1529436 RepID=UPI0014259D1D|nr:replication termination factor 2-like [Anneissia japonica]